MGETLYWTRAWPINITIRRDVGSCLLPTAVRLSWQYPRAVWRAPPRRARKLALWPAWIYAAPDAER